MDGDGRLDFALGNQWGSSYFYHNISPNPGAFLGLHLLLPLADQADVPLRERSGHPGLDLHGRPAYGAQARLTLPDGRKFVAQVDGGSGHSGRRSRDIHIGLGKLNPAIQLSVQLTWRDIHGQFQQTTLKLAPGWHTRAARQSRYKQTRRCQWRNCPMKTPAFNTTVLFYPNKNPKLRLFALWYFTTLMIVWNILGHTYLGFEQSHAAVIVGIGAAIFMQFFLEWVDATAREPRSALGRRLGKFFQRTSRRAHSRVSPARCCFIRTNGSGRLSLPSSLSIGSKVLFRAPVGGGRTQHIFNPSNFGVALTLVLFPQVGFAPPYHFTENITGVWDWILPGYSCC